jgi:hypothetical protein
MTDSSRDLRDAVIRALAKVGLVWAVVVLGALFMAMSSLGQHADGGYSIDAASASSHKGFAVDSDQGPRTAGLVLALLVLGGGATVLAVGSTRGEREEERRPAEEPEPTPDLSLALGLGLLA